MLVSRGEGFHREKETGRKNILSHFSSFPFSFSGELVGGWMEGGKYLHSSYSQTHTVIIRSLDCEDSPVGSWWVVAGTGGWW